MRSYKMFDDALCDELLKHYLEPEYYKAIKQPLACVTTPKTATTLDEYIKLLSDGYINVQIREELDQYVDTLLENEWFHKWPLAYWTHIRRTIGRKRAMDYKKRQSKANVDAEMRTLDALAKEGWPGAMADVGRYGFVGEIPGKSIEQCAGMWIGAYRKGYTVAGRHLFALLTMKEYAKLCDEMKMFVLEGALGWYLVDNNATVSNYKEKLSGWPLDKTRELLNQSKCVRKVVTERALLRGSAKRLFWQEGESPYEINYT